MTIQSVGGTNQYISALNNDFSTLQSDIQAFENQNNPASSSTSATSTTQDQVTITPSALQQALAQVQTDINNLEQSTQGAQGVQGHHHHHHHHHGQSGVAAATNSTTTTGSGTSSNNNSNAVTTSSVVNQTV